jgi:hypothetical protein
VASNAQHLLKSHQLRLTDMRVKVLDLFMSRAQALSQNDLEQELGKVDQLAVRRGRRTGLPADVHAPAQCVYHLCLIRVLVEPGNGLGWPAFMFTHRVSVPNPRKPASMLG